jgi:hypothetical protein
MSSTAPTELSASAIIAQIEAGTYPREVLVTVARGFLPLAQEDLIVVLSYLSQLPDAEIAELARVSLADVPARSLHAFASNEGASPEYLRLLSRASADAHILEALIRNRAVPDGAIVDLARRADPAVQEIIVINQSRILRAPEILDALLQNPQVTTDARRRALETREEFFEKKARLEELKRILGEADAIDETLPDDAIADLLDQVHAEPAAGLPPIGEISVENLEETKKKSMWAILATMTVSEKVQLAFKGSKSVRMVLIRERNRLISSATIRNPRMTENEVEQIAGMRDVTEDVLRIIGNRRDWTSKYPIAIALVKNPKAPVGVVLPLINRLTLRDLKGLKDDKGVSDAVRVNARKLYQMRQKS